MDLILPELSVGALGTGSTPRRAKGWVRRVCGRGLMHITEKGWEFSCGWEQPPAAVLIPRV